jgi:hypothetical protein
MIIQHLKLPKPDIEDITIVHSISKDFLLNSPTSKYFKKQYNSIKNIKNQNKKIGEIAMIKNKNRYILYMLIKDNDWDIENEFAIVKCLMYLNNFCKFYNITEIMFIKNDYRNWDYVIKMIGFYLINLASVTVCEHVY